MSEVGELYQCIILRHGRHSPYAGTLPPPHLHAQGFNPKCGDEIELFLRVENGVVQEARFVGEGCLLSRASASILCACVPGMRVDEMGSLHAKVRQLLRGEKLASPDVVGDLPALSAAAAHPARHGCVTMAWEVLVNRLSE